ncbi:MAG TPA: hypothetical protein VD926_14095 [Acidimicrobiales bacterium]|nr:hypothetical protein [Acidimicrobiales bacterium]
MPPVLVVLFWIWVVVSIVILVKRRIDRRAERAAEDAVTVDANGLTVPVSSPIEELVAAGATPAPHAPTPPPGFEVEVAPVVERHPHRDVPAAGVADALVGIRMPCDLVPLVFDRLATHKITLSTTGYPAQVVGEQLADEVERLGYVVRPISDREVIATRGATELRMGIHAPGPDGRHVHHPSARDDSVVVEISLS